MREAKLFTLSEMNVSKENFEKLQQGKARGELKEMQLKLQAIEARAKEIIETLLPFSFDTFKDLFEGKTDFQKQIIENDVFTHFTKAIDKLKEENRVGTVSSYQCSFQSLTSFTERNKLGFHEMKTGSFLR